MEDFFGRRRNERINLRENNRIFREEELSRYEQEDQEQSSSEEEIYEENDSQENNNNPFKEEDLVKIHFPQKKIIKKSHYAKFSFFF